MKALKDRIVNAFPRSRKLNEVTPSEGQVSNIEFRLHQIFTDEELENMDDKRFVRQVERVWPVARYIDRD